MKERITKTIFRFSLLFNIVLYSSIILMILAHVTWAFEIELKYVDSEAVSSVLVALVGFLVYLNNLRIEEAEFSPAYAFAQGYVINFIEPVINQLTKKDIGKVKVAIFRPRDIPEIYGPNKERIKQNMVNQGLKLKPVQLEEKGARSRDIIKVYRKKNNPIFFDFPNTLTSLIPYVDYKVESKKNSLSEKKKESMRVKLTDKFFEKVEKLLAERGLTAHVIYIRDVSEVATRL